jgi:hypothetical protein
MRYTAAMRILFLQTAVGIALVISSVISSSAQTPATDKEPKVIRLSGCVVRDERNPNQYTINDPKSGGTYRVTGKDFRKFLGQPVQLDGGVVEVKGLVIKGGLLPNPNIAAQAGSLDPSRAAVQAATSGSGANIDPNTPEFRVKTIRPGTGVCE